MLRGIKCYLGTVGLIGLLCAVKSRALNSTILYEVHRRDVKYPFRLRIASSDVTTCGQVFLDQEYDFHVETQPKVIVDAGANIGLASIYFASKYPEARIISIEPEQSNFDLLKKNTAPYANVIPVQAALWSENGEINVVDLCLGKWGFMTKESNPSGKPPGGYCHKVLAITVDKIIDQYELDRIDILKIDIEGAEKEVFRDTSSWIEKVEAVIIELHERLNPGCNRSFYNGSNGFKHEWQQGENVYLTRGKCLPRDFKIGQAS